MGFKLSVIVPYHNSEATLERTLLSLSNQQCEPIEIVLVNDGSTDHSHDIVKRFLADNNSGHTFLDISYDYQRGASEAFNIGLKNCTGDFICKCDSDDTVDADYYSALICIAHKENATIVSSPMTVHSGRKTGVIKPFRGNNLNSMSINTANFSLCNRIISRELLIANSIEAYPHIDRWDDLGIVARVLALKPKTAYIQKPGYHYYLTPGMKSLSRSGCNKLLRDHLLCALLVEHWLTERGLNKEYAEFIHLLKFVSKVKMLRCSPRDVARWKATFPETNNGIMHLQQLSLTHRILFTLITKLPTGLSQWAADKF